MSQYVEQFPLPNPSTTSGKELIALARRRHDAVDEGEQARLEREIDSLVWAAFGLPGGSANNSLHAQSLKKSAGSGI